MSKNGELIESVSLCAGVNTYPLIMTSNERVAYLSNAVNRSVYRGFNDTRPPYVEVFLKFQLTEDENTFRNAAVHGMKFYEGEGALFSSFLIVAVGDLILAGYIKINVIEFIRIYKGIDPQWNHAFFCKALNILTYNDSKNPGLYWTGDPSTQMKRIYESSYVKDKPMPISNVSVFAFGRIFPATPNNLVYASDWIYAQGLSLEGRESVLAYTESTYPSSGDGFGSPSEMGSISGMIAVPQSNTLNGYGDILVACRNGVFSIAPNNKERNEWTNDIGMQKNVLAGKGCVAHNSICIFNNQILYRDSNNEFSSLNLDISNYQNTQEFTSISRSIDRYTNYDSNSDDIQFCCSAITNKRFLSSVSHRKEKSVESGIHRYGMGIVSACVQKQEGGSFMSWEGIWTGIRPTAMAVANVGNIKRTYIASYDHDKKNRLYFVDESLRGPDQALEKKVNIRSKFTYSSVFSDISTQAPLINKKLTKIEALIVRSKYQSFTASYTSDMLQNQKDVSFQFQLTEGCGFNTSRALSEDITGTENQGYTFNVSFQAEGVVEIAKIVFASSLVTKEGFAPTGCSINISQGFNLCFKDCSDNTNNFDYFIYG